MEPHQQLMQRVSGLYDGHFWGVLLLLLFLEDRLTNKDECSNKYKLVRTGRTFVTFLLRWFVLKQRFSLFLGWIDE